MQHRGEHTRNGRPDKARTRRVSAAAPHLFFFLFLLCSLLMQCMIPLHNGIHFLLQSGFIYNVENLFDTISSPFRNDSDFTPSGRYRWDAERYRTKLSRIARTIDDAGFDIVALAEVESERAVRDLTATLADDYNFIHRTNYVAYPASEVSVEGGSVTIQAGKTASNDITVTVKTDNREALRNNVEYMLPLTVRAKTGNVSLSGDDVRVNYFFSRQCKKEVKNILFFEVNSTNPLNALEYRLKDGSMFFDAVVLFSANIRWNAMSDEVYLYNNPNVQALLDGSEVYLQPLRKAGIKVLLGLLGDHTPAGVANLTDYGAKMYASDVANAIKSAGEPLHIEPDLDLMVKSFAQRGVTVE